VGEAVRPPLAMRTYVDVLDLLTPAAPPPAGRFQDICTKAQTISSRFYPYEIEEQLFTSRVLIHIIQIIYTIYVSPITRFFLSSVILRFWIVVSMLG
jgi:hypothetical protein